MTMQTLGRVLLVVACAGSCSHDDVRSKRFADRNDPLGVPADAIVQPDVGTNGISPGTLPGSPNVLPDGTATYSIPLWVAPGRRGIQPELSLEYSSRSGAGLLGRGWSLAGLSAIQRCSRAHAVDGYAAPVRID